jgi:hypothetical protein
MHFSFGFGAFVAPMVVGWFLDIHDGDPTWHVSSLCRLESAEGTCLYSSLDLVQGFLGDQPEHDRVAHMASYVGQRSTAAG